MTFAQVISAYLALNVSIAIAFVALKLFSWTFGRRVSARAELSLHYSVLTFTVVVIFAQPFLPKREFFKPPAKVWSAESARDLSGRDPVVREGGYLSFSSERSGPTIAADDVSIAFALLAIGISVFGLTRIGRDLVQLLRIRRNSYLVRRFGSVAIYANDEIAVPFSHWVPGRNDVIVPLSLMGQGGDFRTVVAHELQHHRQRDTRWVYAMWALRIMCAPNPAIHLWNKTLSEIQEFACDETLVDQRKVESREYARCLVEVAQTARNRKRIPVCATGLLFLADRNLLMRRIENMVNPSRKMKFGIVKATAAAIAIAMTGVALASQGLVQDRRVSMNEARKMLANAKAQADFPIVLNEAVLKQLNRYVGTPDGREFMRSALVRLESHRAVVQAKLTEYDVPTELIAVPITESGYKNMSEGESATSMRSAGLWQFIPSTARNYGLKVDATRDERLDVAMATDAALRYLESNHLRFRDWHLALLAYNMGENRVQRAMTATGAKDAWTLIRLGHEGDKDYLPKMMAAILIMKNPEYV
ncbi:MAG: M56 and MltD domain-containing protein, partial [Bdellovibrionota bacterium]